MVLLTATMFVGVLTAGRAKSSLPAFARAEIHRRISILTVAFLAVHVLTAVIDTYAGIRWTAAIVPFTSGYHTFCLALGTIAVDLFLAVALSSALRRHLSARTWRLIHWLAYASWPVAIAHGLGMGTDRGLSWVLGLVAVCIASVVSVTGWRVADSLRQRGLRPPIIASPRPSLRVRRNPAVVSRGSR
jgi:sulfoxide reductase heme-binding subunit YedZ